MPYKSEKQRKFMHARHPEIARRWDKEYGGKVKKMDVRLQADPRVIGEGIAKAKAFPRISLPKKKPGTSVRRMPPPNVTPRVETSLSDAGRNPIARAVQAASGRVQQTRTFATQSATIPSKLEEVRQGGFLLKPKWKTSQSRPGGRGLNTTTRGGGLTREAKVVTAGVGVTGLAEADRRNRKSKRVKKMDLSKAFQVNTAGVASRVMPGQRARQQMGSAQRLMGAAKPFQPGGSRFTPRPVSPGNRMGQRGQQMGQRLGQGIQQNRGKVGLGVGAAGGFAVGNRQRMQKDAFGISKLETTALRYSSKAKDEDVKRLNRKVNTGAAVAIGGGGYGVYQGAKTIAHSVRPGRGKATALSAVKTLAGAGVAAGAIKANQKAVGDARGKGTLVRASRKVENDEDTPVFFQHKKSVKKADAVSAFGVAH